MRRKQIWTTSIEDPTRSQENDEKSLHTLAEYSDHTPTVCAGQAYVHNVELHSGPGSAN